MDRMFDRLAAHFAGLEDSLNTLDAQAGDGDHGTTILRGLRAAAAAEAEGAAEAAAEAAAEGAAEAAAEPERDPVAAFRRAAGGAAGSLFAQVLVAAQAIATGAEPGPALADAARRIAMLGQARAGDRTMLDALLPAAQAADLGAAAEAARGGAAATAGMSARRGRARYVEGAGLGHVDAGARSVAEILSLLEALGTEAIP